MSELGQLLELMHGARSRWQTVRATIRSWRHQERFGVAWERHHERESRSGSSASVRFGTVGRDSEPEPETFESSTRLWVEGTERVREEHSGEWMGPRLGVRIGERWWSYDERTGAISNEEAPEVGSGIGQQFAHLLDPAPMMGLLELERLGDVSLAKREAIRARAVPRDRVGSFWGLHPLPAGADDYELVVDRERGVLLRVAARLAGEDFYVIEVLDIAFDEQFPPETFVFEPPAGEEIRNPLSDWRPAQVTIDEAQNLAPFTVWIPDRIEAGWQMTVHFSAGGDRPPVPATVSISYHRQDASRSFSIQEAAVGDRHHFGVRGEPLGRKGETLLVREPDQIAQVQLERDGPALLFQSSDLGLDGLLELVDALVPAPSEPPQLTGDG
jgi:hypothetical protein